MQLPTEKVIESFFYSRLFYTSNSRKCILRENVSLIVLLNFACKVVEPDWDYCGCLINSAIVTPLSHNLNLRLKNTSMHTLEFRRNF